MNVRHLPPLREVIAQNGLGADKRFGQHYLLDLNLTGKIGRLCGDTSQSTVFEVGPGPGGLTILRGRRLDTSSPGGACTMAPLPRYDTRRWVLLW